MANSFFVPLGGDRYQATVHTTGPWDARSQHGGPPSALLGRVMQQCEPRGEMMIARFTCEILRPIPVGELTVTARVARAGRSVELLESVASAGGREVARGSAWRVLRTAADPVAPREPAPTGPPDGPTLGAPDGWVDGYLSAIDWRAVKGGFTEPGPATVWGRMRYPLVDGEEPSPLERVLIIADSGNGASWELPIDQWHFINPELTVHLHREAAGEWVCLDAHTAISPGGVGLATSTLSDTSGPIGVGAQSLLVALRPEQ
jgi:hypothetical protein